MHVMPSTAENKVSSLLASSMIRYSTPTVLCRVGGFADRPTYNVVITLECRTLISLDQLCHDQGELGASHGEGKGHGHGIAPFFKNR
jgi:hypothetical protein